MQNHIHGVVCVKDASVDFEIMRERFPVFECKAYMDSCSYGALATDVSAAFERYMQDRLEYGSNWGHWIERNEAVRASVAKLLGAEADEIAINGTSSSGINSLASALDFSGPRNRVVITDLEFPTNAQIWYAQEARGPKSSGFGRGTGVSIWRTWPPPLMNAQKSSRQPSFVTEMAANRTFRRSPSSRTMLAR